MASTPTSDPHLEAALPNIPVDIRTLLVSNYVKAKRRFLVSDYEHAAICLGKFAESALRAVQAVVLGTATPIATEIRNFLEACQEIERAPRASSPDGLRLVAPRALAFLYTLRSKRGFGHATGGIDPRQVDVGTAMRTADWVVAELVSQASGVPLEDAQTIIDAISVREVPAVWQFGGKKRVLVDGLTKIEQTLLLMYSSEQEAVLVEDLAGWVEHPNVGHYRRDVVKALHRRRLIEHDEETETVMLTPKGSARVQRELLTRINAM